VDVVGLACCADLSPDYSPAATRITILCSNRPQTWRRVGRHPDPGRPCPRFLHVAMTNDVYALTPGECQPTWILEPDGQLMSPGMLKRPGEETTCSICSSQGE